MSSLDNFRQGRRPVTHSHYTRKKRSSHDEQGRSSNSKNANKAEPSGSDAGEYSKRKGVKHSFINTWLANHLWAMVSTLGSLYRTPVSTLMTTIVIGIALALPAGLYLVLQNVQYLSSHWDRGTQISLFLQQDVKSVNAQALAAKLQQQQDIENVAYISAEQALEEFRQKSGFEDALSLLDDNPLPAVLVVTLKNSTPSRDEVTLLMEQLNAIDDVDMAQLDMQWLERLNGLIEIGWRSIFIVAAMLGLAILVIVSNTIRLTIQNRRQEIEVTKLIGGTDGFIRRPFLYGGIWYGVIGCLIAMVIIYTALNLLEGPVNHLAGLYNSGYTLIGLNAGAFLTLMLLGVILSWLGSWFSVWRHLREIEPK